MIRDKGQSAKIRDCPGRSGTVGTYALDTKPGDVEEDKALLEDIYNFITWANLPDSIEEGKYWVVNHRDISVV